MANNLSNFKTLELEEAVKLPLAKATNYQGNDKVQGNTHVYTLFFFIIILYCNFNISIMLFPSSQIINIISR